MTTERSDELTPIEQALVRALVAAIVRELRSDAEGGRATNDDATAKVA